MQTWLLPCKYLVSRGLYSDSCFAYVQYIVPYGKGLAGRNINISRLAWQSNFKLNKYHLSNDGILEGTWYCRISVLPYKRLL